jgi:pimeloyl-ACP methyl ester carboxylesterase
MDPGNTCRDDFQSCGPVGSIMVSPSDPQDLKLAVNGIHIHVARLTGGQRPLLLLHGWPEFWLTWLPVMQRLAAQGYDLIAPDLRGFGDSANRSQTAEAPGCAPPGRANMTSRATYGCPP